MSLPPGTDGHVVSRTPVDRALTVAVGPRDPDYQP
jgi:hypothetical protein